ncbi:PEP/pyruvate-binding domain-containing protein, partial [Salinimicrobium oceani]
MNRLIRKFEEIGMKDVPVVGGKNASLGEMYSDLASHGVRIPNGFATTAEAFRSFLKENGLDEKLENLLGDLDRKEYSNLEKIGGEARKLILE